MDASGAGPGRNHWGITIGYHNYSLISCTARMHEFKSFSCRSLVIQSLKQLEKQPVQHPERGQSSVTSVSNIQSPSLTILTFLTSSIISKMETLSYLSFVNKVSTP